MMNSTLPIMCIARWFLTAPRRSTLSRWPSIARLSRDRPTSSSACRQILGVISSHSSLRSRSSPSPPWPRPRRKTSLHCRSRTIFSWSDLLRKTFAIDTICPRCKSPLRLIALIETEDTITKILSAMGLPTEAPKPWPARPPPSQSGGEGGDCLN